MSNVRSLSVADADVSVKVLGTVIELWCVSEEVGFSILATDLEPLIDALLRAYIETGQGGAVAEAPMPTPRRLNDLVAKD